MQWYAAHILLCVRYTDNEQKNYPVMENIVLIQAASPEVAWQKAEQKGNETSSGFDFIYAGKAATWEFVGIRRIMECIDDFDPDERLEGGYQENGTEVTYSSFIVDNEESLRKLIDNENVTVVYESKIDSSAQ